MRCPPPLSARESNQRSLPSQFQKNICSNRFFAASTTTATSQTTHATLSPISSARHPRPYLLSEAFSSWWLRWNYREIIPHSAKPCPTSRGSRKASTPSGWCSTTGCARRCTGGRRTLENFRLAGETACLYLDRRSQFRRQEGPQKSLHSRQRHKRHQHRGNPASLFVLPCHERLLDDKNCRYAVNDASHFRSWK